MIQLIVFDMAGTTIDEGNVVYQTLQTTLQAAGYQFSLADVLTTAAGKEKRDAIASLIKQADGTADESKVDQAFTDFLERLKRAYAKLDVKPCPNADRVLAFLKVHGIKVALNTGYNRYTAQHLLHRVHWKQGLQFDLLVTAEDANAPRPAPNMIQQAQQKLGVEDATHVAKVGDSQIDIEEGKNAGCGLTIGVTTGAHSAEQLRAANPDYVIDNLEELVNILGNYSA